MMARWGFHAVILDDFLIIGSTQAECQMELVTLIRLLHSLGFNVSWRKVVSPTQRVTFLGIELDSTSITVRLPVDKLSQLIDQVCAFSAKVSASKRQLQSLAGSLNSACQVACVASVSVWFRSKKRPWKGIFGCHRARNETREPKNERGGGGGEGRKRLQTNPSILKTCVRQRTCS